MMKTFMERKSLYKLYGGGCAAPVRGLAPKGHLRLITLLTALVMVSVPVAAQQSPERLLVPFSVEVASETLLPFDGSVSVSPNGSKLLLYRMGTYIAVFSMGEGLLWYKEPVSLIGASGGRGVLVTAAAWLDDERILLRVSDGRERRLIAVDASTGSPLWSYAGGVSGYSR